MELKDFTRGIAPKPKPVIQKPTGFGSVPRASVVATAPTVASTVNMVRPSAQALTGQNLYNAQKAKDQNRVDESPMSGVTTQNKWNKSQETPYYRALNNSGLGYLTSYVYPIDYQKFATPERKLQNAVDLAADIVTVGAPAVVAGAATGGLGALPAALGAGAINYGVKGLDFAANYLERPGINTAVGATGIALSAVNYVAALGALKRGNVRKALQLAGPLAYNAFSTFGAQGLSDFIEKRTGVKTSNLINNIATVYPFSNLQTNFMKYGQDVNSAEKFVRAYLDKYRASIANYPPEQTQPRLDRLTEAIRMIDHNLKYNAFSDPLKYLWNTFTSPHNKIAPAKETAKRLGNIASLFGPSTGGFHSNDYRDPANFGHSIYNPLYAIMNGFDPEFANNLGVHEYTHGTYRDLNFANPFMAESQAIEKLKLVPRGRNPKEIEYHSDPQEQNSFLVELLNELFKFTETKSVDASNFDQKVAEAMTKTGFAGRYDVTDPNMFYAISNWLAKNRATLTP